MPGRPYRRPERPTRALPRRPRALLPTLAVLAGLLIAFTLYVNIYTDLLWFRAADYSVVYTTQLFTRLGLFAFFGLLMGGLVAANIYVAWRVRPSFRAMSVEQQSLDRYRMGVEPYRRLIVIAVATLLGLLSGLAAAGQWRTWLLWRNGESFGIDDPHFGIDVSFFAFDLPWWRFVLGFLFAAVILSLIAAAVTHYLYGGIKIQTAGEKVTAPAQAHISVLLGVFVLLKAVAYWLDRYGLAVHAESFVVDGWTGLRRTDVDAVLPAKTLLAVIALICAGLFFANVVRRTWLLPGLGLGLLVLSAILIGGVYPALYQQFRVKPSEQTLEATNVQRNVDATRTAYGLEDIETTQYNATTTATAGQLRDDAETTASIRLMDPAVISRTFSQDQQVRGYYGFPDPLDIDRYEIDGEMRDVVIGVRELNEGGIPTAQQNWLNLHTNFTHGFGVVAAYGNTRLADGHPSYAEEDIPPEGVLGDYESRIYFGELSTDYVIVGEPEGAPPAELDFPDEQDPSGQQNTTYTGGGGVEVGSLWRKLLFSTKFREPDILLSDRVNEASEVLWIREPRERVERVAPWLTLDGNAYPAVVDGRVLWIIDGYTTTGGYPYSTHRTLGDVTETSLTAAQGGVIAPQDTVNYIRNSVKATVDAHDGTVTLYAWDDSDPVLQTWMNAFPDTVQPRSEISDSLLSHLRYPEDLFKVQRDLLAQYHVSDPVTFYTGQDFWLVPADPTDESGAVADQPPYFLTIQMPGQDEPAFSLTTTLVPQRRDNLAAFVAVNAEAESEDYGRMRVLQLPSQTVIPGPRQMQNNFNSDPDVSQDLNLLTRGGQSQTLRGNLLTLPVGGGLLYVEPIYVEAASGTRFPLLQRVLVGFGERIAIASTLQEALDEIFSGEAGVDTGEEAPPAEEPPAEEPPAEEPPAEEPPADITVQIQAAIADAQQAYADGQAALAADPIDFAAYGEAQERLEAALNRLAALQEQLGG